MAGSGWIYALDDVTEEASREEKMVRQEHLASMGLLASQVAHEVNTPLTGIASYTQMLMSRLASRLPEMDLLRKIEAQAFRAAGIAGSVLNFARRRDGEAPQTFEPAAMAAECLALFQPHVRGKGIRVVTRYDAELPRVRGHRGRMQQVVMNLLLNAAQALPGGGEVRLELEGDGDSLRIQVGDDGVGIPSAALPRIFEPFFSTRPEGTGLGLAVVRRILDEHHGTISVESEPGRGSTFTVTLPAAEETGRSGALGA
jgi:signal transduction histidine kinase